MDKVSIQTWSSLLTLPSHDKQYLVKKEFCRNIQLQKSRRDLCETRIPAFFPLCSKVIKITITKYSNKLPAFHLQCLSVFGQGGKVSSTVQLLIPAYLEDCCRGIHSLALFLSQDKLYSDL